MKDCVSGVTEPVAVVDDLRGSPLIESGARMRDAEGHEVPHPKFESGISGNSDESVLIAHPEDSSSHGINVLRGSTSFGTPEDKRDRETIIVGHIAFADSYDRKPGFREREDDPPHFNGRSE